ncbi:MAG: hypothetical protein KKE84_05090 [Gammaproteobacteria bacterium]|nr:hypothetical protein [Gammaproteobacteria bacterium]
MKNRLTPLFHLVNLLRESSVLAEGNLATVRAEPRVVEVYLGR